VKINGIKPRKLLNAIAMKKAIGINVILGNLVGPSKVLNSLCSVIITLLIIIENRDGINQNENGIIITPKKIASQLIWI